MSFIAGLGAVFFGLVVGWIAYWILRLRAGTLMLSELLTLLAVLAGAAVIALFNKDGTLFGWYSVGLVVGFFAYFAVGFVLYGKQEVQPWRIGQTPPSPPPVPGPPPPAPPVSASSTDVGDAS